MSWAEPDLYDRIHGSAMLRADQRLGRLIGWSLSRLEVHGAEHIPERGPVILAMNHRSLLDGPLVFGVVCRPVSFLVKREAFVPVVRTLLRSGGQIPVVRQRVDPAPVRLCVQILRGGGVVGIYPEGTRGAGWVQVSKPGVAYLALRTGASVVPVAAQGTERLLHPRGLRRPPVSLTFGRPIPISPVPDNEVLNQSRVAELAEQLRLVLADLVRRTATTMIGAPTATTRTAPTVTTQDPPGARP